MRALDKVLEYVQKENMVAAGDRIVVGISGGADSVCLICMLDAIKEQYNLELVAVNIEHGIRGQESLEDTEFVKQLCKSKNIPCRAFSYDVPELAKQWTVSLEEAGRRVRYQAFNQVAMEKAGTKIAVAHNANDNVETIIHNMARGTGLAGITGIPAIRGAIIRPLLCLERREIEEFLTGLGQNYRNDSTNQSTEYTRNRIRHGIIPQLSTINEAALRHITDLGNEAGEIEDYLKNEAEQIYNRALVRKDKEIVLSTEKITLQPDFLKGLIIRHAVNELTGSLRDISRSHLKAVAGLLSAETGKSLNLPGNLVVQKSYNRLIITYENNRKNELDEEKEIKLNLPGQTMVGNMNINASFPVRKEYIIPKSTFIKGFNYDRIKGGLKLRHRQNGDSIIIDEQGRRTKLKDYLINEKIPVQDRDKLWLLCDEEEIIWIIGLRISEFYKIEADTQRVLHIEVTGGYNGKES